MAKKAVAVKKLVDKKGNEKKEYPKLVRVSDTKKVLCQNADEEAALGLDKPKAAGNSW